MVHIHFSQSSESSVIDIKELFSSRFADEVSTGDEVLVQGIDELIPAMVTNISSFRMQGSIITNIVYD